MEDFNNALASFGNTQSSAQSYISAKRDKFFKDYQDRLGVAAQAQAEALGLDQEKQEKLTKIIETTGVAAPIIYGAGKRLAGAAVKRFAGGAANQVASVSGNAADSGTAAAAGGAEEGGSAAAAASGGAADAAPVAAGNLSSALASGGAAEGGGAAGAAAGGAADAAGAAGAAAGGAADAAGAAGAAAGGAAEAGGTTAVLASGGAAEGASGLAAIGTTGATAEAAAPWATEVIAPAIALAAVGYGIWDLFHPSHSHSETAPPATYITGHATGISDSITRGGFATAGIDSVTSLPAQNSAF